MASGIPIIRQVAWLSLVPQVVIMLAFIAVSAALGSSQPSIVGVLAFWLVFFPIRLLVSKHHRRGIALCKKGLFNEAIPHFLESYEFFSRHSWLDNWRYITLLSSSRISYRELALLNVAFCYGQIGLGQKAREYYGMAINEFPGSRMAEVAMRLMDAARNDSGPEENPN